MHGFLTLNLCVTENYLKICKSFQIHLRALGTFTQILLCLNNHVRNCRGPIKCNVVRQHMYISNGDYVNNFANFALYVK